VRRRRAALVGSRTPEGGFLTWAGRLAEEVAAAGVGVVSGAALGVDRACHYGALAAGGETWAFLGSALDEVDPAQMKVAEAILGGGGCIWSELPPGTRASRTTFPRRNRLISGASDAVVILRAAKGSGTLLTRDHARAQGRPVLAVPGNPWLAEAEGANRLIQDGQARLCLGAKDVFEAVGLVAERVGATLPPGRPLEELGLSEKARAALVALEPGRPRVLEDVLAGCGLPPLAGVTALAELESAGLLVQHPSRLYERV
jgi:DNA processing protein